MKIVNASCPNCGGEIVFDKEMSSGICAHCGTKVFVDKNEQILVFRDEAKLKEIELKEQKELESKKNAKELSKWHNICFFICVVEFVAGIITAKVPIVILQNFLFYALVVFVLVVPLYLTHIRPNTYNLWSKIKTTAILFAAFFLIFLLSLTS